MATDDRHAPQGPSADGRSAGNSDGRRPGAGGVIVVVCGLPGVGKTTVAEAAAARLDARLVRSDVVRKELFADPEYTDAEERMVYGALLDRGRRTAAAGEPAVLDATFHRADYRELASELAERQGVAFELVKVECPSETVEERMGAREGDESDADFGVHLLFRERYDPIALDHVVVDNSGAAADARDQLRAHLEVAAGDDPPTAGR